MLVGVMGTRVLKPGFGEGVAFFAVGKVMIDELKKLFRTFDETIMNG